MEGLVFTRDEEKNREIKSIEKMRSELNRSLAISAVQETVSTSEDISKSLSAIQNIIISADRVEPIGRIIGDFNNYQVLSKTYLVNQDKIHIPSRQTTVSTVGR